jgi:hypothetical protein
MLASSDGELAAVSKGSSSYTVTWRGASSPAGACKVTERNGRVTVFFPETYHGRVFLDNSEFSLIAEAQMPDSFARATPAVGSGGQWAAPAEAAVTACCLKCGVWCKWNMCSNELCHLCCRESGCCGSQPSSTEDEERRLEGVCVKCGGGGHVRRGASMELCSGFCNNGLCVVCCQQVGCCGPQPSPAKDEEEPSEAVWVFVQDLACLPCLACDLLFQCNSEDCPCGFCLSCCEDLCWFYGTSAIHWHQDSSLCECPWSSDEDEEDPAPAATAGVDLAHAAATQCASNGAEEAAHAVAAEYWAVHGAPPPQVTQSQKLKYSTALSAAYMEAAPAAAAGEGRGNSEDLAQRVIDAILAANVTQAEVQAAAAEGTAAGEDALYWSQQLALLDWSDERGRSVSGKKLNDAVTTFLDEGGEMSTDAHGCCSLYGCSLLQLRRYNELQHQHQHQHQQGACRPSEPGRWQPTHMLCGAFFVPICEHCYHEDCEGECLEDDPCLHGW